MVMTVASATALALVAFGLPTWRGRVRPHRQPAHGQALHLALLLRIGLSAGLSLGSALAMAGRHLDPAEAALVTEVERQGLLVGLTMAMSSVDHQHSRLFRVLADASATGAPALFAVTSFIADESERLRTAALKEARGLPVKLTVPVALGLLPGFVLLTVAPQIALALRDLIDQLIGV